MWYSILVTAALMVVATSTITLGNPINDNKPAHELVTQLETGLLTNYDKRELPLTQYGNPVNLYMGFVLINIVDVNQSQDQVELNGWLDLRWKDSRLVWDPTTSLINRTLIDADRIWLPDLALYNSVGSIFPLDGVKHRVSVKRNGQIDMWTPTKIRVFCNLEENLHVEQSCSLDIGSWTYNGFMLNFNLLPGRNDIKLDHYKHNKYYEILSTSATRVEKRYDCCPEVYTSVKFTLNFKRRSN